MFKPNSTSTAEPRWIEQDELRSGVMPSQVAAWLRDTGSLTRAVTRVCPGHFGLAVQSQGWGKALPSERSLLAVRAGMLSLVREVELQCDGLPWVFARTLVPASSLHGAARRLAHLRNKPLGAVLFSDPRTRRLGVQVARLNVQHGLYHAACSHLAQPPGEIWGRRTLFSYGGKRLLVNEIFLPTIAAYRT
jgi:chorismate lyase